VLLTADGCGTMELTHRTGTSKTSVWRWQERFLAEGVPGLLRDKTRPARIPPLGAEVEARVAATQTTAPGETTHWTSVALARHIGISVSSVQRIWRKHGLQPHKTRPFKLSNDPRFAAKLLDIVGLYVNPPEHAVVLSIDEKSQIQALDRAMPKGRPIHVIVDNYATHKRPTVRAWLARHRRWTFHCTPPSASWLNAVEGFFAKLAKRRLKRGVFCSVVELQAAINRFLTEANLDPPPFRWTKDPHKIIAAVKRGHQVLVSIH
jgi:transposase